MKQTQKPFGLRMPPDVKDWLAARAASSRRSMNAEIVTILVEVAKLEPANIVCRIKTNDREPK